MLINWIVKIIQSLNANQRPGEMAWAMALAFWIALLPPTTPLGLIFLVLAFFLKLNQAILFVFLGLFSTFLFVLDPVIHEIGYFLLNSSGIKDFFLVLWNTPGVALLKPNNTLVVGAFLLGLILMVPWYFLFRFLIQLYREKLRKNIAESAFIKFFLNLPLIKTIYQTYEKLTKVTKAF